MQVNAMRAGEARPRRGGRDAAATRADVDAALAPGSAARDGWRAERDPASPEGASGLPPSAATAWPAALLSAAIGPDAEAQRGAQTRGGGDGSVPARRSDGVRKAPHGRLRGPQEPRMPPQPQFQRGGRLRMSADDRETLRQLAAQLDGQPRRWKTIASSDFGRRLGLDARQLRHVLKSKAYVPSSAAGSWTDELQRLLVAEVAARGRAWASIQRDGGGGAFSEYNVETLRRNYDHPTARHHSTTVLAGRRVRGVARLPRGRFRVIFRQRILGTCDNLAQAARTWNAAARAAGVPPEKLNIVPDDEGEGGPDTAQRSDPGHRAASSDGDAATTPNGEGAAGHATAARAGAASRRGMEQDVQGACALDALKAMPQQRCARAEKRGRLPDDGSDS